MTDKTDPVKDFELIEQAKDQKKKKASSEVSAGKIIDRERPDLPPEPEKTADAEAVAMEKTPVKAKKAAAKARKTRVDKHGQRRKAKGLRKHARRVKAEARKTVSRHTPQVE